MKLDLEREKIEGKEFRAEKEKEKEAERIKRRIVINCQVRINLEEELAALKRFKKSEKKK